MKVSVVVTVLNEEDNIERLISALLKQNKKPDEILIVDGGSLDTTVSRITNYKLKIKNSRLKLFIKPGNRSMGRNYGIKHASTDIIAVTDAGGYPKQDWLEKITKPFEDQNFEVVSGYYKTLARTPFEKCITPYFLVMPDQIDPNKEFLPSSRSIAFRKSVWKKIGGYPEEYSHNEDLVFDKLLKNSGARFYFEPRAIVYWSPPKTLRQAARQFFRFALGDAESGIDRPKIKFIYLRYFIAWMLVVSGQFNIALILLLLYLMWSIRKNFRWAPSIESLFWLPIIQITSDLAVMLGNAYGWTKKKK